jgi:hypothetical protein
MPAGLRDFEFDQSGKPSKDEINDFYSRILSLSNVVDTTSKKYNDPVYDIIRSKIQIAVNALYDYIKSLLEGKHKLVLGKWASRRIYSGTRNVITSLNNSIPHLDSKLMVGTNDTVVGLFQYLKSTLPISIHNIRSGFLSEVFIGPNNPANLVNKKTLKKELVNITADEFDEWMTGEGIEKVINRFGEDYLKDQVIEISDRYLALVYKGKPAGSNEECLKIFQDIDELPPEHDKGDVYPITLAELLYMAVYKRSSELYGFFTRYPITGFGSIYPTKLFLKTTVPGATYTLLDSEWNTTFEVVTQYPKYNTQYMNSMSPSSEHLARLDADEPITIECDIYSLQYEQMFITNGSIKMFERYSVSFIVDSNRICPHNPK